VTDPPNRAQIEVDVAVLAPEDPGRPRQVLSLGEAKWNQTMTPGHLARLRRARDLLSVRGFDTTETVLACYAGTGFSDDLHEAAKDPKVLLVDLETLYG
jgi:uncharacterized protein